MFRRLLFRSTRASLPALALLAIASLAPAETTWAKLLVDADALRRAGEFSAADLTVRAALKMAAKASPQDVRVPATYQLTASISQDLGNYMEAESWYRKAIAILERSPERARLAFALRDLGTLYFDAQQFSRSETTQQRALKLLIDLYGPEHTEVGNSLNNLGSLACARKKYSEAYALYLRAFHILEKAGDGGENLAHVLNNLGVIETTMGRYESALEHCRRAATILEGLHAPGHPATIASLTNIATIYARTGRAAEGLQLIDHVLELTRRCFGDDHPRTALVLANRAVVLRAAGRKREAKQTQRMAQTIVNAHPGIRALSQRVDAADFKGPARAAAPARGLWVDSVGLDTPGPRAASAAKDQER